MIPTFIINLDRQPERLNSAMLELGGLNLELSRLSAIDMHTIDPEKGDLVTLGVKACWQSHLKVFKIMDRDQIPYALIFEDDLHVKDLRGINSILDGLDISSWDLIQLGFITPGIQNKLFRIFKNLETFIFRFIGSICMLYPRENSKTLQRLRVRLALATPKGFVPDDFLPGTHAYLISNRLARASLILNSPQFLSADDFFIALSHMRSFKCLRVKRSLFGQKKFPGIGKVRFIHQE